MITEADRLNQIAAFYDCEAQQYDCGYSNEVCLAENERVKQILTPIIHGKVLDIGCGSGLLKEIMDVPEYTGIEISPRMTRLAKDKFSTENFIVGDMHSLPFDNNQFDSVVSLFGPFSYSLTPVDLVSELKRVLKPGGKIAVMPYSLRVGNKLALGGYSTATEDSIEKIFYTQEMLSGLFQNFSNTEIQGINYFLNIYQSLIDTMGYKHLQNLALFEKFLEKEDVLKCIMPPEFARHMIITAQK